MARSISTVCARERGTVPALFLLVAFLAASAPATAQTEPTCVPAADTLCLAGDRFKVTVEWVDVPTNQFHLPSTPLSGSGQAVELSEDTGYFWFFEPDNAELLVKVIDGRIINQHFWVFYGATTNVEYTITVTDTRDNSRVMYPNPQGRFSRGGDTAAFEDPLPDAPRVGSSRVGLSTAQGVGVGSGLVERAVFRPRETLPSCNDPAVTCIQNGRIAIEGAVANPFDPQGPPFQAMAVETTSTSAITYFFDEESPDTVVKVLDARPVNGRFWIFASTLTDQEVELRVTDLQTGMARIFRAGEGDGGFAVGDRQGFRPDPPAGPWLETSELPGFRFKVRITGGGAELPSRQEARCVPETLCISGAVPGRSELFLRMVGPKPNGFLWPNIVKFSTSQIEIWIEQLSTGQLNYYKLDAAAAGETDLNGLFDRFGFEP